MIKTRTITFRSDAEIDFMIKEIQRYHKYVCKGMEHTESSIIRAAIYWYYDDMKSDNEFNWKENCSKNLSLTNKSKTDKMKE